MRLLSISWPAVVVGSIVSLMVYLILNLFTLGGQNEPPLNYLMDIGLGPTTLAFDYPIALSFTVMVGLSLLVGAFAAARVTPLISSRQKLAHGLVVAVVFFLLLPFPAMRKFDVQAPGREGIGLARVVSELGLAVERLRPLDPNAPGMPGGPRKRAEIASISWTILMTVLLGGGAAVLGAALGSRRVGTAEALEREEVSRAA